MKVTTTSNVHEFEPQHMDHEEQMALFLSAIAGAIHSATPVIIKPQLRSMVSALMNVAASLVGAVENEKRRKEITNFIVQDFRLLVEDHHKDGTAAHAFKVVMEQ